MDLFNVRAIEVTRLAMDGLLERQKSIASNTANAMTPEFQRKDVVFEDQLRDIIEKDDIRRDLRAKNSAAYSRTDTTSYNPISANAAHKLPQEQMMYLQQTDFDRNYKPEVLRDYSQVDYGNGNNVNLEEEMMDMAKSGQQYNILATVEGRMISGLMDVVKGGGA